ncbi:Pyridoxal phosphate-dependent transferase, major domain protein [Moelleriella libera RCEF 2490]|uniref:Pyridoxal phosphate-dependent transferase, major domain protein n=1 Tax=Moelleriella libera RCEF 2490 TaxID=1081109 RepID=A0A168C322_9HYPO|nr:Pyridoxal phosphate-dependent transferase, major domain protein [Moelleriella libera RCEF 2490]
MDAHLSKRSAASLNRLDLPWRFASAQTYNARTNPDGLISFATAENRLVTSDVQAFVNKTVKCGDAEQLTYGFSAAGGSRFPAALAAHLNEYFRPHEPVRAEHITVTGAATPMHEILAWGVADAGEGILTSRPVYGRFELDFGNRAEVEVVYADTNAENCFDEEVVSRFEDALVKSEAAGTRIRALLIVNPHNPLGRCYPRDTLIALMNFCQSHKIHLISDEIYACSVFDSGESAAPFTSVLSICNDGLIDTELLHVTYGLSKDFGCAGLRVGAIITRSKAVEAAVRAVLRFHNPAGPSLAIGAAMLEDRKWCREFIAASRARLAEAYAVATKGLQDIGVAYLPGSNAGLFLWVDLSPYLPEDLDGELNAEFALAKKLQSKGVFLHPREEHSLTPGWFRLVYTQDADIVKEGIKRIGAAIVVL